MFTCFFSDFQENAECAVNTYQNFELRTRNAWKEALCSKSEDIVKRF